MSKLFTISIYLLLIVGSHQIYGSENTEIGNRVKRYSFSKEDALKVLKIVAKLPGYYEAAVSVWQAFEYLHDLFADTPSYKKLDTDARLDMLNDKVDDLAAEVKDFKNRLFRKLENKFDRKSLEEKLSKVAEDMEDINNNFFTKFLEYTNTSRTNQEYFLLKFAEDAVSPGVGLGKPLARMKTSLLDNTVNYRNIFYFLADPKFVNELMCPRQQSAQQNIYVLYEKVLLTEIRAYLMLLLSRNLINEVYGQNASIDKLKEEFKERMNAVYAHVKRAMSSAPREIWQCDESFIEGKTYSKIRPIFQKYVLHESEGRNRKKLKGWSLFFHSPTNQKGCDKTCPTLSGKKMTKCDYKMCTHAENRKCNGILRDCERKHEKMIVCSAHQWSYRRYEYIMTGDDEVFGVKTPCPRGEVVGDYYTLGLSRCDYCLCTCDSSLIKDEGVSINLRPVLSQIDQNKVVTGVQIINGEMIHLQITEGELTPGARINPNTTKVQPIESYSVKNESYHNNSDYTQITWERRQICLDNLYTSDKDKVLTGLKFQLDKEHRVQLAIRLTSFNFNTGRLRPNDSIWISHNNLSNPPARSNLTLRYLDIPKGEDYNEPRSEPGQCIEIHTSGLKQDAGQHVVPFIDIQPLTTNPPMPISGAGLFLRGSPETGGFLVPKLYTFNLEPHMHKPETDVV